MYAIIAIVLVIAGACFLFVAQLPMLDLVQHLPKKGSSRPRWILLMIMAALFIFGYLAYGFLTMDAHNTLADLLVPAIFFFGGVFVWISARLSLGSVREVRTATMLEQVSETDELTGIFNKRYLERRLYEEISRTERFGFPLSILYLDIDHFSDINKAYGRTTGDSFLIGVIERLMKIIRNSDVVARYNEDEFVIIAFNTTVVDACLLAERLRRSFESEAIRGKNELKRPISLKVTVSMGLACYNDQVTTVQAMLQLAMEAMHSAKERGRSCFFVCQECVEQQ